LSKFQGGFYGPGAISCDPTGGLACANAGGPDIQRFNANGDFLGKFGKNGRRKGQIVDPSGVAVDDQNNFYVIDNGDPNQRLQKFDATGKFLRMWNPPKSVPHNLKRVAISPKGSLYVADEAGHVWVLSKDLKPLKLWKDPPQEKLGAVIGIAFDSQGNCYTTNYRDNRILKFGPLSE